MARITIATVTVFMILLGWVAPGLAGEPTEKIKQTTDKILSILSDANLKDQGKAQERRKLISQAIDERFDWEELSKRSLARHWAKRTADEQKEFMQLYRQLLERTYLDKVEDYSGETVSYEGETIDGNYSVVKIKILTSAKKEIPVDYRMMKKGADWMIYDFSIEGVSLVNNYRSQFNSILVKSSYQDLVQKLKEKIAAPAKK